MFSFMKHLHMLSFSCYPYAILHMLSYPSFICLLSLPKTFFLFKTSECYPCILIHFQCFLSYEIFAYVILLEMASGRYQFPMVSMGTFYGSFSGKYFIRLWTQTGESLHRSGEQLSERLVFLGIIWVLQLLLTSHWYLGF